MLAATTVKRLLLLLDGDQAGREAAEVLAQRLMRRFYVRGAAHLLPEGAQPDTVPGEMLRELLVVRSESKGVSA